jgi:hypothetical protein
MWASMIHKKRIIWNESADKARENYMAREVTVTFMKVTVTFVTHCLPCRLAADVLLECRDDTGLIMVQGPQ